MITQDSFKVRLMTRKRTNKSGLTKIEVEVMKYEYAGTHKVRRYVDTTIWVHPRSWVQKTQRISNKELEATEKQQKINSVYGSILNFVNTNGEQQPEIEGINFDALKEFFPKLVAKRKTLADYIDEYYKYRVGLNNKRNTTKGFITLKTRIQDFDTSKKRKTYLNGINLNWSNELEVYLKGKPYNEETISKTYALLNTVLNHYYDLKDEINVDLSDKFKSKKFKRGKKTGNKPNPLNMMQLITLSKHQFEQEHLKKTQKMILLQCNIGMRYDDIKKIRPEHIENEELKFVPAKTEHHGIIVVQPLNEYAHYLLKEVGYNTSVYDYENQSYNKNIKEIFDIMREKYPDLKYKTYTSHNFRDTFISNAVEAGINWKSIITWVGHSSYDMMDKYIKTSPEFNRREMDKMYKFMVVQGKVIYYQEQQG